MAMPQPPICPIQATAPIDQAPRGFDWIKSLLFGRTWYLFWEGVGRFAAIFMRFPLYHDLVMFYPGNMTVTASLLPSYPAPPQQRVGPYVFEVYIDSPPTGADLIGEIWRSDSGTILGGKMADFTILDGLPLPLSITYHADENYTIPGSRVFVAITQIGSTTPGANLHVHARVQGV